MRRIEQAERHRLGLASVQGIGVDLYLAATEADDVEAGAEDDDNGQPLFNVFANVFFNVVSMSKGTFFKRFRRHFSYVVSISGGTFI